MTGNMGVILRKSRNGNKFKTYKVLFPNGQELVLGNNQKAELAPEAGSEEAARTDSVSIDTVAQEARTVKPLVEDDSGSPIVSELPSNTITRDVSNSLSSWTEEEQAKTRAALEEKGFATEDIDKWMQNVNGIASMVAADRQRLDFDADETKSMVKPNADYGASIDASTLCAKRLLYISRNGYASRGYSSRYSRDGDKREQFAMQLEELMEKAPDEKTRNQLRKTISDVNNNMEV